MDFHGMKRKDLQTLCKKHGIPGNLKNIEMATRLASVFEKDTVNIPEESIEADDVKDDVVARKEAKRVRFSPENEVFEFTRSVKKCQRKNVRMGHAQDLQQVGIELRRSKRIVYKGITVAGSNKSESNTRRGGLSDVKKALELPRRSKRIGSSGSTQETELMALVQFEFEDISEGLEKIGRRSRRLKGYLLEPSLGGGTLKAKTLLPAKRSQRLVDTENKKDELVQSNVKDITMDVQDDHKVEKDIDVQTNTQNRRRSIRLKVRAANSSMGGETSDGRPLCFAKEGKKETKSKQSEGSTVVKCQEGKEPLIDCGVQTTENYGRMKLQDVSKVEKVPRPPKRRRKGINVLMDKKPVKVVKRETSLSELLVDGQTQKGDKQSKRTFGNDREDKKLLRSLKHIVLDNMRGQVMSNSLKSCSVIDCERDGASVGNVKKSNVNDETQVRVRTTRNSSRRYSFEASIVVEGNLVENKTDESTEPRMDIETTSTQANLMTKELLDQYAQFEQEAAGGSNVASGGSSKKPKTMNQECAKDMPQGMIENSPSSSETKAAESVMVIENVLDSTPEKSADSTQRTNNQELNSELMEGKREEKLELDTILMPASEEDKEDVSSRPVPLIERLSPALVPLAISNPEAELVVPTGHTLVKDIASTVIVEENTKTKEEIFICGPISELKEHSSEAKLANIEEPVMISENVIDSTLKSSVDISPGENTQELNSELMEEGRKENHEQDTFLMAAIREKEEASSLSATFVERSEVSNPEVELFVETTQPPASVQLAVSNHEVELGLPTTQIHVKDIASKIMANEDIQTKEEILISIPRSELKEHSFVAKLAEAAECWNEIHSSKDDEKDSLEKKIQVENLHGNFSEYNTENSKVGCISVGHSGNLESLDEVKDDSLGKTERTVSCESGGKLNELELRRWSSTDFTSLSPKEDHVSKCFKEDEIKALSQPLPRNKDVTVYDESAIFSTPERNLMLMEHVSENGKTPAAVSVTHHKDEAVESHVVVFTTPRIDEAGKEEDDTATNFPDESDALNTTERYSMLEGSGQTEARNEGESKVIELHDESEIATSLVRKFSVEEFKGDSIGRNEENRTTELQHESGTCTSLETHELFGSFGQTKARESVQIYEESGLSTGRHRDQPLADSELGKAGWQEINSADKPGLFTSLETQLVSGDSEQKRAVKAGEKADEEFCDESDVPNIPARQPFTENSELDEAAKSEEDKAVELQVDCGIFTSAEKHLLLERDEEMKGDSSHDVHDVFIDSENQSHMGEFEPDEAEKTNRENMNMDLLGESNTYNNPESHLLFGDSGIEETKKIKDHTTATCEESFVFTSPERQQILVNSEPHSDGKEERNEDESAFFSRLESGLVLGESGQAELDIGKSYLSQYQSHHSSSPKFDFRENTIADSSGSMASKVSYNHEFNVGQETAGAELMKKGSQAEDVDSLDATQGKSKKNSEHSPHVDSVNLFDFNIEEAETIVEAERNVLCGSYILALPIEGNSDTVGEISSYLEVAGTCSMVSEEYGPSTDVQNQIHDAMEELALTDNTEVNELIEAKVAKTSKESYEGNVLLNSSGGSYVSGKTCVLAGAEAEHLSLNSEVHFRNTCEKSVPKFIKDEAADSIATAFVHSLAEKAISLTSNELTVHNNMNEKAADEEMIRKETTPSLEETLLESSEKKEYLNIDESSKPSEKQVRREPVLIYRTQVKLKSHDMKENAPNSKIVDNLNVTAPRISKRQPLQNLRKN